MKYFKIFTSILFGLTISFYACNNNSQNKSIVTPIDPSNSSTPTEAATSNTAVNDAAQNTAGVWHYTCSNGCSGGAASAVNCTNCGSLLVHNQAYHGNASSNNNSNSTQSPIPLLNPSAPVTGQNTAGVWHYTCSKGCAGGSGSAVICSTCGNTLAHNQAYHQ
jgi:hypothetical protein